MTDTEKNAASTRGEHEDLNSDASTRGEHAASTHEELGWMLVGKLSHLPPEEIVYVLAMTTAAFAYSEGYEIEGILDAMRSSYRKAGGN